MYIHIISLCTNLHDQRSLGLALLGFGRIRSYRTAKSILREVLRVWGLGV